MTDTEHALARLRAWDDRDQSCTLVMRYTDEDGAAVVAPMTTHHPGYLAALRGAVEALRVELAAVKDVDGQELDYRDDVLIPRLEAQRDEALKALSEYRRKDA